MEEVDERVLAFVEALKKVGSFEFECDFADSIGMQKQNIGKVRRKQTHFTIKHIDTIRKVYNGNPNWFFGVEKNMFLTLKPKQ
jgi:hypothetical protein